MRCVLRLVRRPLHLLRGRWHARYPGRGAVSIGRGRFELGSSGWSWVSGVDAVGGPPHGDFTDDGRVRVASRRRPDWLRRHLAGVVLDLIGEVGDELGSLCQILAPNGMIMKRLRNAGKPGKRPWVGGASSGRRQSRTAAMSPAVGVRVRRRLSAGGGVGAHRFRPRGRAGVPGGSATTGFGGESGDVPGRLGVELCTVWGPTSCSAATWRPSV